MFTLIYSSLTFFELLGNKKISICADTTSIKGESSFFLLLNDVSPACGHLDAGFLVVTQFSAPRRVYTGGLECVDCNTNLEAFLVNNKCVNSIKPPALLWRS